MLKHGDEDPQQAIGDSPQGTAVAVSSLPECSVVALGLRVTLRADPGPVVDSVA